MVDEISALGLRHVGYNVPIEYFGPFVSACIETLQGKLVVAEGIAESFAWSVGIISRMLVRTIKEGSTIATGCYSLHFSLVHLGPFHRF